MNKAHHRFSPICFITGASSSGSPDADVSVLLESGIRWVQYREKNKTKKDMLYEALRLREIAGKYDACFIVNDHVDIALAVDADGVHLGQDDLPLAEARKIMGNRIVGISTHSLDEALSAERGGADYIGFGPVFLTTTKDAGAPKGVDVLRQIKDSVSIPVIAIGGIKAGNIQSVLGAGCYGVAVSSGLLKGDIKENAKRLISAASSVRP